MLTIWLSVNLVLFMWISPGSILPEVFPLFAGTILGEGYRVNINFEQEYVLQSETSYPYLQDHIQKFGHPETPDAVQEEEKLLKAAYAVINSYINEILSSVERDPSVSDENKKKVIREKLIQIRAKTLGLKTIHITLDSEDDAYVIFETLNTRGKNLDISDLLKNHLVKLIRPANANVDLTKDKWNEIVKKIGALENVKVDEFLYHHWLSKYEKYVPRKRLFKSIRKQVKFANAKEYLEGLHTDAEIYFLMNRPASIHWNKNDLPIRDSLVALNLFRVKQQIPMVLTVMREYKTGNLRFKQTRDILQAIEKFHFIFSAVTSQRSSGGISGMHATHAIRLTEAKNQEQRENVLASLREAMKKRLPNYEEFEANFYEIRHSDNFDERKSFVHYVLSKLDEYHRRDISIDYGKMTFEHLSSQNPKNPNGVSPEYVAEIGNLLLVGQPLNDELDNKNFSEKKKILSKAKIWQDDVLNEATSWGEAEIRARSRKLAELAYKKVWKI
ncbi:MAG: hypothetical protein MHPDNHAH_03544 [Anaerolineales bacterium]|nr:hypothetical protein [Anaerolineales bacterium]